MKIWNNFNSSAGCGEPAHLFWKKGKNKEREKRRETETDRDRDRDRERGGGGVEEKMSLPGSKCGQRPNV